MVQLQTEGIKLAASNTCVVCTVPIANAQQVTCEWMDSAGSMVFSCLAWTRINTCRHHNHAVNEMHAIAVIGQTWQH